MASPDPLIAFVVPGAPATKGSFVSFVHRGRVVTKSDTATLKSWTRDVQICAIAAGVTLIPKGTGVVVGVEFQFTRPARARRMTPCIRPDCDKLARALLDALTGIAYADDGQVIGLSIAKMYGGTTETRVAVEAIS